MQNPMVWDLYFSGLVGWALHPGYMKDGRRTMSLEQCADLADEMMIVRRERCLGHKLEEH